MKYFVDFEATQFSNEIIAVGCIAEDGRTFYSLAAPSKLSKVTPFITNLTGITKDMMSTSLNVNEVFCSFYDFFANDDNPLFYCYGESDEKFTRQTFKYCTSLKAKSALGILTCGLVDLANKSKTWLQLKTPIGLFKALKIMGIDPGEQTHNALDDAIALKTFYDTLNSKKELNEWGPVFKEHLIAEVPPKRPAKPPIDTKFTKIEIKSGKTIIKTFESEDPLTEAAQYVLENEVHANKEGVHISRIQNKILTAGKKKCTYCRYTWYLYK